MNFMLIELSGHLSCVCIAIFVIQTPTEGAHFLVENKNVESNVDVYALFLLTDTIFFEFAIYSSQKDKYFLQHYKNNDIFFTTKFKWMILVSAYQR